jgi:probable rRNA maturation factor
MKIEMNRTVAFPAVTNMLIRKIYKAAEQIISIPRNYTLSVAIVSNAAIQNMNRIYRKKNYPTDVLSFRYDEEHAEVVLSAQKIRSQAKEYGHSQKMEAAFLLVHGLLHTLGWDHERTAKEAKEMRAREEQILRRCGIDCAR